MQRSLCDFLEDVAHNAVEAGARLVALEVAEDGPRFEVIVADDGPGMDEAARARALDPFGTDPAKHAARRVGLGLPFLAEAARQAEGEFELRSEPGTGTSIRFCFDREHVDTPPVGDLAVTLTALMNFSSGRCELAVRRRRGSAEYSVASSELADAVGALDSADALLCVRSFFRNWETELENADGGIAARAKGERTEAWPR